MGAPSYSLDPVTIPAPSGSATSFKEAGGWDPPDIEAGYRWAVIGCRTPNTGSGYPAACVATVACGGAEYDLDVGTGIVIPLVGRSGTIKIANTGTADVVAWAFLSKAGAPTRLTRSILASGTIAAGASRNIARPTGAVLCRPFADGPGPVRFEALDSSTVISRKSWDEGLPDCILPMGGSSREVRITNTGAVLLTTTGAEFEICLGVP